MQTLCILLYAMVVTLVTKSEKTLVDTLKIHHKYCKQLSANFKAYGLDTKTYQYRNTTKCDPFYTIKTKSIPLMCNCTKNLLQVIQKGKHVINTLCRSKHRYSPSLCWTSHVLFLSFVVFLPITHTQLSYIHTMLY